MSKAGSCRVQEQARTKKQMRRALREHRGRCDERHAGMGAEPEVPPEEATSELGVGGWAVCQAGPWGQGVVAGEGSSMLRGPEALRERVGCVLGKARG